MLISESVMFAINDIPDEYLESAVEVLGYKAESYKRGIGKKRIISFMLAAALIISMGFAVYAIGEILEYRRIKNNRELTEQSKQGAEDILQFSGKDAELNPGDYAIYMDNETGQGGVTTFDYWLDKSNQKVRISYYDSGEVQMVDARDMFLTDYAPYNNGQEWFDSRYPDRDAYKASVVAAIPGLFDDLKQAGWIKHAGEDVEKADILNIHLFWDTYAQLRVLTKDGCAYELWFEPDTLMLEGFMYWNAQDAQNIRNGFFTALKEDRLEEWWDELMSQASVG